MTEKPKPEGHITRIEYDGHNRLTYFLGSPYPEMPDFGVTLTINPPFAWVLAIALLTASGAGWPSEGTIKVHRFAGDVDPTTLDPGEEILYQLDVKMTQRNITNPYYFDPRQPWTCDLKAVDPLDPDHG